METAYIVSHQFTMVKHGSDHKTGGSSRTSIGAPATLSQARRRQIGVGLILLATIVQFWSPRANLLSNLLPDVFSNYLTASYQSGRLFGGLYPEAVLVLQAVIIGTVLIFTSQWAKRRQKLAVVFGTLGCFLVATGVTAVWYRHLTVAGIQDGHYIDLNDDTERIAHLVKVQQYLSEYYTNNSHFPPSLDVLVDETRGRVEPESIKSFSTYQLLDRGQDFWLCIQLLTGSQKCVSRSSSMEYDAE